MPPSRPGTRSVRSIPSTGPGWRRRSSITSRATSWRPSPMTSRSPSPCPRAISAIFAPATSPAAWACPSPVWCWPPTKTTCWTNSSAPGSIARAIPPRPASPPALPWIFPRLPISSASSSTWWAATRPWCASCGPRWIRARPSISQGRPTGPGCRSSPSFPAAAPTPTASGPSVSLRRPMGSCSTPIPPMASRWPWSTACPAP